MRDIALASRSTDRVAALVWHCLLGIAPVYLQELCRPG